MTILDDAMMYWILNNPIESIQNMNNEFNKDTVPYLVETSMINQNEKLCTWISLNENSIY